MHDQIARMLELQDNMNLKVNDKWRLQNFEWYRAIWIESAELMDHFGWKWWKKQIPDMAQVRLEIIDIWHFGLSILLQEGRTTEEVTAAVSRAFANTVTEMSLPESTERFAQKTLESKGFDLNGFCRLMTAAEMTFNDLYCGYIGKNVLNFFRQNHGYKTGDYKKLWQGREDNEHLVEIIARLDHQSSTFQDDLYKALESRYETA